jgi:hypothetical protein
MPDANKTVENQVEAPLSGSVAADVNLVRPGETVGPGGQQAIADVSENTKYLFFIILSAMLVILAFAFNKPLEIWQGSLVILTSPANLVTDYFALANIGATLLNAGLMTLFSLVIVRINRVKISGSMIAAIFTVLGFSFFGKTCTIRCRSFWESSSMPKSFVCRSTVFCCSLYLALP